MKRLPWLVMGVFWVVLLSGVAQAGMPTLTKANFEKEIKKLNKGYKKVEWWTQPDGHVNIHIFHHPDSIISESWYFKEMYADMTYNLQKIVKSGTENIGEIIYFLHVPTRDSSGNKSSSLTGKFHFRWATLKKIKWDNVLLWDSLEMAYKIQLSGIGKELGRLYCRKPSNRENTPKFCSQVR